MRVLIVALTLALLTVPAAAAKPASAEYLTDGTPAGAITDQAGGTWQHVRSDPVGAAQTYSDPAVLDQQVSAYAHHACWASDYYSTDEVATDPVANEACAPYYDPADSPAKGFDPAHLAMLAMQDAQAVADGVLSAIQETIQGGVQLVRGILGI